MPRFLAVIVLGLALAGPSRPQDLDAKDLARILAPFVNDTTQGVGHVNVAKLELKKYFEKLATLTGPNKELDTARDLVLAHQAKLVAAGIRDVLAVINVSDFSGRTEPQLIVVAPLAKNAEVDDLLKLIGQVPKVSAKVEKNRLIARLGDMGAIVPKERPEFAEALEVLKDKSIQLIAAPSQDVRQLVEQKLPALPPPIGGETTLLTRGVRWLAVSSDSSLTASQYLIQAKDAMTAKDLKDLFDRGMAALARMPGAQGLDKIQSLFQLTQQAERLTLVVNEATLTALLVPAVMKVREAAARTQSANNLKQIALAMHIFHDQYKVLPARANFDAQGKPLLSWRVHILPYVEQQGLYSQFKLNEPWDSPHNKKLIERIPPLYQSPASKVGKEGKTTYLAVTGKQSLFDGNKGLRFTDVPDGTSNTIMVVETNDSKAVYWTQPEDFPIDTKEPLASLLQPGAKGFNAAFADGGVRFLSATIQPETLRALFTRNGNEVVDPNQ